MDTINNIDFYILDQISKYLKGPILDKIMVFITSLGNSGAIWIVLAISFLLTKKYRKTGIILIISLMIGLLIGNIFLKNVVARERPFLSRLEIKLLIASPKDFSFPSGHTLASFISATIIWLRHKKIRIYTLILAILISFSRLYLYVHFPSDVLIGIVLGIFIGYILNLLFKKYCKG